MRTLITSLGTALLIASCGGAATNASPTWNGVSAFVSTPAAAGAASTKTFLAHCFGRSARRSARPDGTPRAGLASPRGSEVWSPSATRG